MTRSQTESVSKDFILNCKFQEDGKFYELWYNPTEKDCIKAYFKKEVKE